MKTIAQKEVVSIARDKHAVVLFTGVISAEKSLSSKLVELAECVSAQVANLALPQSSKCALIEATYAAEFKNLSANRNTVATLRALIVTRTAGEVEVEVKEPSKDGKVAAVFKPAHLLSASEAKKFAAEIKAEVKADELSPEEKAKAKAVAEAAAKAAQVIANASATKTLLEQGEKAFAFCLSKAQRPALVTRLAAEGLELVKIKSAPKK